MNPGSSAPVGWTDDIPIAGPGRGEYSQCRSGPSGSSPSGGFRIAPVGRCHEGRLGRVWDSARTKAERGGERDARSMVRVRMGGGALVRGLPLALARIDRRRVRPVRAPRIDAPRRGVSRSGARRAVRTRRDHRGGVSPTCIGAQGRPMSAFEGTRGPLDGKVGIVTGASKGIGTAAAIALAHAGAAVAVPTDVGQDDAVRQLVERTLAAFGRLDLAVNNAAGGGAPPTPLADLPIDAYDSAIAITLR